MKNKILTTALCSSALLLTACGGSSSSSEDNSTSGNNSITSNVNYSKAETSDLVTYPVMSLIKFQDNPLYVANIASEIYEIAAEGLQTSCESGTVVKNSNGSVTLNNCKNYKIEGTTFSDVEGLTLSGTVNGDITATQALEKYIITLTNVTIKNGDEVETYNGQITQIYTYNETTQNGKAQYSVNKMEMTWANNTENERYSLTDYALTEEYGPAFAVTPAIANGTLQGDVNGQKFSVKFDSNYNYDWSNTGVVVDTATINIQDTTNSKNAITIQNTTGGKALISAFANGTSVVGFPKTVDWSYFD